jgi:Flp pilus assembly protein TadG
MIGIRGRNRRGTATVELALALPALLVLFLGVVDVTRAMQKRSLLNDAATAGARRAMETTATDSSIRAVVAAAASPIVPTIDITRASDSLVVAVSAPQTPLLPAANLIWDGPLTIRSVAVALLPETP